MHSPTSLKVIRWCQRTNAMKPWGTADMSTRWWGTLPGPSPQNSSTNIRSKVILYNTTSSGSVLVAASTIPDVTAVWTYYTNRLILWPMTTSLTHLLDQRTSTNTSKKQVRTDINKWNVFFNKWMMCLIYLQECLWPLRGQRASPHPIWSLV